MNRDLHHTMTAQYAAPKVSGNGVVRWDGGVKCVLPSVKLCGAAAQDGTPTPDAPVMRCAMMAFFRHTAIRFWEQQNLIHLILVGVKIQIMSLV